MPFCTSKSTAADLISCLCICKHSGKGTWKTGISHQNPEPKGDRENPSSLLLRAARRAQPGPGVPLAPAGQERDGHTGTRTGGWNSSPGAAGPCQAGSFRALRAARGGGPSVAAPQAQPWGSVPFPSPAVPFPRRRSGSSA